MGRSEIGQTYTSNTLLHWNGSEWQLAPSQSVAKETNGLVDITCVSSSACWAVGYQISLQTVEVKTLILRWDGTSWQIVPSPNVGSGFNALYGVSCTSESNCWAVGFENGGNLAQTLIEKWDGNSWQIQQSPNVGTQHNVLNAVTCVSAANCWAVGYEGVAGNKSGLVAKWDGNAWSASALQNQLTNQEEDLSSVTCNSAADCWASGDSYNGAAHQTLMDHWDGTAWTNAPAPNGGVDNYLSHVACNSGSDCWAVGHSSNAAVDPSLFDQNLVLHWNGSLWLISAQPVSSPNYASDLSGIACAGGSECWAAGATQPAGSNRSLIEKWDGSSWATVVAPDVPTTQSNYLDGVTCTSESDCWAAGFLFYGTIARSLILHWDGKIWQVTDSPNSAIDRSNYVGDITCTSASDCWAVGSSTNTLGIESQALTLHWDGTAWSVVNPAPVDTSQEIETTFEGVACAAASDCWAVGFSLANDYQGMIQHWNGTAWVIVPTPVQQKSILYDVACAASADCTAVGVQWTTALTGSGLYQTLVEHWDGTSWSAVASPNTSSDVDNILSGVTCSNSSDCWAVGSFDNYSKALIEHWDGTSWNIVQAPQVGSILNKVTCSSEADCWAAGPYYTPNPPAQTLLLHWDGAAWTKVASPNTSAQDSNTLSSIACAASSHCWAVGRYSSQGTSQTLILRYAPSALLTSAVSRKVHGGAGPFDINLPLTGNPGIECRSGGENGDYTLVFSFDSPLTNVDGASVTSGNGTVTGAGIDSNDAHNCVVNLTGVTNAQYISVGLNNVSDLAGNFSNAVVASMGVLLGDVDGSGRVDSNDVFQVRQQGLENANTSNFRMDVDASGRIDSTDVFITRQQSLTSLP